MRAELITVTVNIWDILQSNIRWMGWNLFLAFVPLDLSVSLFRRGKKKKEKVRSCFARRNQLANHARYVKSRKMAPDKKANKRKGKITPILLSRLKI